MAAPGSGRALTRVRCCKAQEACLCLGFLVRESVALSLLSGQEDTTTHREQPEEQIQTVSQQGKVTRLQWGLKALRFLDARYDQHHRIEQNVHRIARPGRDFKVSKAMACREPPRAYLGR